MNSGEGKINSKLDVKWNLSPSHMRCNCGRLCGVCTEDSVFVSVHVCDCTKATRANRGQKLYYFDMSERVSHEHGLWVGVGPKCSCHVILMLFPSKDVTGRPTC